MTVARTFLGSALLLALALVPGCGGGGLTVIGTVDANVATPPSQSGFHFDQNTRIDGAAGLVTGSCELTRSATGSGYGVVLEITRSDTQTTGDEMRSITVMTRSDAAQGEIEAQLGMDQFTNASCAITVTGVDERGGAVSVMTPSACTLTSGTRSATVTLDLDFGGCTVMNP